MSKKFNCSMQKKIESLAKKSEANSEEYITEWQADIIKGLEKVKDEYGLDIKYNGPFSDEWKEYPTYSVFVRKGGKKEDIGTVGTDYVHAFVEYTNPGMNVSRPHKAKDYSAEEAVQVILNSANLCLGKKGESKKSEGIEDQPEEVQQMVKELAEYTENDVADAKIEDYAPGNGICVTFGDEEYYCYADRDDAEAAAKEGVKDFLETEGIVGIRFENIGGIEQFLNVDWFKDAQREDAEFYVSDIKESEPERYKEEFGDIDEEDAVEKCLADWGDDYIQWFKDNFGDSEFETAIKENGLVDYDALAEAIVDHDGPAMELASYDNNEILLDCDCYCYRHN